MSRRQGSPIRAARLAAGLTQQQAADRMGWSQPAWAKVESRPVDSLTVARLRGVAKALRIKARDLL